MGGVCRVLRHDDVTSHVDILLLSADDDIYKLDLPQRVGSPTCSDVIELTAGYYAATPPPPPPPARTASRDLTPLTSRPWRGCNDDDGHQRHLRHHPDVLSSASDQL